MLVSPSQQIVSISASFAARFARHNWKACSQPTFQYVSQSQSASFQYVSLPASQPNATCQQLSQPVLACPQQSRPPFQYLSQSVNELSVCQPVLTCQQVSYPVSACQSARFSVCQPFRESASFQSVSRPVSQFWRSQQPSQPVPVVIQLFNISVTPSQKVVGM